MNAQPYGQSGFNPNSPLARHSGEGRNPAKISTREADKDLLLPRILGECLTNWIPAFAGMTMCSAVASAGVAACLLLSGCATHTAALNPQLKLPAQWSMTGVSTASPATGEERKVWWMRFNDTQLDTLIAESLRSNNTLASAILRVQRARLQAGLSDTSITPTVSLTASTSVTKTSGIPGTSRNSSATGSLSYELDLWGRLASQRDASTWEAQATLADCQTAALTLIGTTATLYWQVALNNQQIAIGESNLADAEKTLALVRAKYAAGAASGLDVAQAEQNLSGLQADQTQLVQQRTENRHALAILFDQPPEAAVTERSLLSQEALPPVEANLPASLLGHRPDLHADELRLRESLANVDATKAGFYPAFTLSGSYGLSSSGLSMALQNPVSILGVGLTLPFIQWNTTQLTIKVSESQYAEAVSNFRQHLYSALAEVEDALSARVQYSAEAEKLSLSLEQARRAESLIQVRYRAGAINVQLWLDAQQKVRSAEMALAQNRFNQLSNLVKLNKALGNDVESTCAATMDNPTVEARRIVQARHD